MATTTAKLNIIIDAQNKTQRAFANANKGLAKMNEQVKKLGPAFKKMAVIGTAGLIAITAVSKKAIEAFMAQERAEKRLEQITRQTTNATDKQIQSLKDQAVALQRLGVVGDDIAIFGQSQLATFALQTEAIEKLTPGILDLAVATKGVNATQEDMINIGNLVGKVMTGQVGALSRLGITFSDTQAEILKTGTEMERASTLADVLAGNFGGLNEAMRQTSEGQLKALQNDFGDLQEKIGAQLIPILNELVTMLVPVVEKIVDWVEANPQLTKNIIIATAGVSAFLLVMGVLGLALPGIIASITALGAVLAFVAANPIVLIIGGLVALVTLFAQLVEVTGGVGNAFIAMGDTIIAWWKKSGEFILDKIMKLVKAMQRLASFTGGKIKGLFDGERADGGPVSAGRSYLVGERGPEIFSPQGSGSIIPNNAIGGGGNTVIIQGGTFLSEDVAEMIGDMTIKRFLENNKQ